MRKPLWSWSDELLARFGLVRRKSTKSEQRKAQRRRALKFESLEPREMLASDLMASAFRPHENGLVVSYDVFQEDAQAFDVGIYRTIDGQTPVELLATHRVSEAEALSVGSHELNIAPQFTGVSSGDQLLVRLDVQNEVGEVDETNNQSLYTGEIIVGLDGQVYLGGEGAARVADNSQTGYTEAGSGWTAYSSSGAYQGGFRYHSAGDGSNTATWTFEALDSTKRYQAFATWNVFSNRASNAPFTVFDDTTALTTVRLSQQGAPNDVTVDGRGWESLGVYQVTSGRLQIQLSDDANGFVNADAIRLVEVPPVTEPVSLIDDGDAAYAETGSNWLGQANAGAHDGDFRYHSVGTGQNAVTWTFDVLDPSKQYRILATWNVLSNRASNAPYTISNGTTDLATVRVTQQTLPNDVELDGRSWESLGVYQTASGRLEVTLTDDANGFVNADAIRLVEVLPATAPVDVIDDGDATYSETGTNWLGLGNAAAHGGDLRYHSAGTGENAALWTFDLLDPTKQYRVLTTWNVYSNRASNAPFTIYDDATALATIRVNQQGAPNDVTMADRVWESLGVYQASSGRLIVKLTDDANGFVNADAIRLVEVPPVVAAPELVDDGDTAYAELGENWLGAFSSSSYQGDTRYHSAGTGSNAAQWTFASLPVGQYAVYTTWNVRSNAASNAPFTVYDGYDALATVTVNQRVVPSDISLDGLEWKGLGVFVLASGAARVRVTDLANGFVTADAVRFVCLNAAPVTSGLNPVSVDEDAAPTIVDLTQTFSDDQGVEGLTFDVVSNTNAALVQTALEASTGQLSIAYAPNASGTAEIVIRATDAAGLYAETTLSINVAPVNDAPTTTGISDVAVIEDAAPTVIDLWSAFVDVDDALTYEVVANSNPALFAGTVIDAATRTLTLSYAPNAHGTAVLTIRGSDSAGQYAETSFSVVVAAGLDVAPVMVDNSDASFCQVDGPWSIAQSAGAVGGDYLYRTSGSGDNKVTWTFDGVVPGGRYELLTTWTADVDRASNATFRVYNGVELAGAVVIDQKSHPLGPTQENCVWQSLRVITATSDWLSVTLTDQADGLVIADAVRLVVHNLPPNATPIAPHVVPEDADPVEIDLFAIFSDREQDVRDLSFVVVNNSAPEKVATWLDEGLGLLVLELAPDANGLVEITVRAIDASRAATDVTFLLDIAPEHEAPMIGALLDAPDPAIEGAALNLEAVDVSGEVAVASVAFYRDVDGDGIFDPEGEQLLGIDTDGSDGWTIHVLTAGFGAGAQQYYAVATDIAGMTSAAATCDGEIGITAVLDNGQTGYIETGAEWQDGPAGDGFNGNYRYHAAGAGEATAAWSFDELASGLYRIMVRWIAGADRATNAAYKIYDGATLVATVAVDQTRSPLSYCDENDVWWEELGVVGLSNGSLSVVLDSNANGVVVADAVRLVDPIPAIESLVVGSDRATVGGGLTLRALGVHDTDTDGTGAVTAVRFYHDSGDGQWDANIDTLLLEDANGADGWSYHVTAIAETEYGVGLHTFFAVALDNEAEPNLSAVATVSTYVVRGAQYAEKANADGEGDYEEFGDGWQDGEDAAAFSGDYRYHEAGGADTAAIWTFDKLLAGTEYEVWVTWLADAQGATHAPFEIFNGSASGMADAVVTVNQQAAPQGETWSGAGWQRLGTFAAESDLLSVRLRTSSTGRVTADAIRIVPKIVPEPATYEAEEAVAQVAIIDTRHSGFTGGGFVDFTANTSGSITWSVTVDQAGAYDLKFRYALQGTDRPLRILVNGVEVAACLSFPDTGSWKTWRDVKTTAHLAAGLNVITAEVINQSGANIDHLAIAPAAQPADTQPPDAPQHVVAEAQADRAILLKWNPAADNLGVVGYRIYRVGQSEPLAEVTGTVYIDAGLTAETTYQYEIAAFDAAGNVSVRSALVSAATRPLEEIIDVYEAEGATIAGAVVTNAHPGATGAGFVDLQNAANDRVTWTVKAPKAGDYVLTFRYALGASQREMALEINGQPATPQAFATTGDWTKWGLLSTTVTLTEGENTIALVATGQSGPNVDNLAVVAAATVIDGSDVDAIAEVAAGAVSPTETKVIWVPQNGIKGVTAYEIRRNGVVVGRTSTTSFVDRGLTPGVEYVYSVRAINTAQSTVRTIGKPVTPWRPVTSQPLPGDLQIYYKFDEPSTRKSPLLTNWSFGQFVWDKYGWYSIGRKTITQQSYLYDYTQARDSSGQGHHGRVVGAHLTPGVRGEALILDGWRQSYVASDYRVDQKSQSSQGATFAAWVCPTMPYTIRSGGDYLVPVYTTKGKYQVISTSNGGYDWSLMVKDGYWAVQNGTQDVVFGARVSFGQWQHVATVFTPSADKLSGTVTLYVNGRFIATLPGLGYDSSTNPVMVGDNPGHWNQFFGGRVDEVRVYNKTLMADEIGEIYTGNQAPDVYAGPDQTLVSPNRVANLTGFVDDDSVLVQNGLWSMASGPGQVVFANAQALSTTVTFSTAGTYVLKLTASDGQYTVDDLITIVVPDFTPPQAPSQLEATVRAYNRVDLSWQAATDDDQVAGYRVYRNSTLLATVTNTQFSDTGSVSAGVEYQYLVVAFDRTGNLSVPSNIVFVTRPLVEANLVGYWSFDVDDGATTFDNSGGGKHGTISGAQWTNSDRGGALEFNGTNAGVTTSLYVNQSEASPGATFAAWVKPTSTDGRRHVISSTDGGNDWALLCENGKWAVATGEGVRTTAFDVVPNMWQHVAAVFDPKMGEVRIFVNGQRETIPYLDYDTSTNPIAIGRNAGPWGEYFAGSIDEARVYDRPLSWASIAAMAGVMLINASPTVNAGPQQNILSNTTVLSGMVSDDGLPENATVTTGWSWVYDEALAAPVIASPGAFSTAVKFTQMGEYRFLLTASDGELVASDEVLVVVPDIEKPSAVTGLVANVRAFNQVDLTWAPSSDNVAVSGYRVYRDGQLLGTVGATGFIDTGLTSNTSHQYWVVAFDGRNNVSDPSEQCEATTWPREEHLIGHWSFDDPMNLGFDNSGLQGHGTVSGATWTDQGRQGGALVFDGVDDGITTPVRINQAADSPGATFAAWVCPTGSGTLKQVVSSTNGGYDWAILRNGNYWSVATGASNFTTQFAVEVDTWQHIAAVFDPAKGEIRFYWNGQRQVIPVLSYDASSNPIAIGRNSLSQYQEYFAGAIDEVRVYDRPIAWQRVAELAEITLVNLPPTVFAGADQSIDSDSAVLSGTVSDDGLPEPATLTTTWSWVADDGLAAPHILTPGELTTTVCFTQMGTYRFTLTVSDGDLTAVDEVLIVVPDIEAPDVVTGLVARARAYNQVDLAWDAATDNIGVAGYRVYRNGTQIGTTSGQSFSDLNAESNQTYSYTVRAYDVRANLGVPAPGVELTTPLPQPGEVGYWSFDDQADPGFDGSGNRKHGTLVGPSWTADGRMGGAMVFDGNDRITTSLYIDQSNTSPGATFAAWVRPSSGGGNRQVLSSNNGGTDWALLLLNGRWTVATGTSNYVTNYTVDLDVWQHVAVVFEPAHEDVPARVRFYRNTDEQVISELGFDSSTGTVTIGHNTGAWDDYYVGQVDEVHAYQRPLSYADICSLAQVTPGNTAPIVDAGEAQTIATNVALLAATASDDGIPSGTLTTLWTKFSGPGSVTFAAPDSLGGEVTFGDMGTYVLRLTVSDGERFTSDDLTVTVLDYIPPSAPSDVTANVRAHNDIRLTWQAATDNVGVVNYFVYRNGVKVATLTETSYVDTTVDPLTSYIYAVSAIDAQGNEVSSTPVIVATPPVEAGLVGYWTFDDSTSLGFDNSGSHNHGIVSGANWVSEGHRGGALQFNGDGSIATPIWIDQSSSSVPGATFAAWVKPEGVGAARQVISTSNGNYDWSLMREGEQWAIQNGKTTVLTGKTVRVGEWQHIAAVFDPDPTTNSGMVRFYLDGEEVVLPGLSFEASINPLMIGDNPGPWDQFFVGAIDEVHVYDRALTIDDIHTFIAEPPTITAPATYRNDEPTVLRLNANHSPIDYWDVSWGDGTSTTVLGSAKYIQHAYTGATGDKSLTATAYYRGVGYPSLAGSLAFDAVDTPIELTAAPTSSSNAPWDLSFAIDTAELGIVSQWQVSWGDNSSPAPLPASASGAQHTFTSAGRFEVTVTATMTDGGVIASSLTVMVDPPVVASPIADQRVTLEPGQPIAPITIDLSNVFSNPGGASLAYAVDVDNPAITTARIVGTQLTLDPSASQTGSATITVIAIDPVTGGLEECPLLMTVSTPSAGTGTAIPQVSDLPNLLVPIPDLWLYSDDAGEHYEIDLADYFYDADGDDIAYSINVREGIGNVNTAVQWELVGSSTLRLTALPHVRGSAWITVQAADNRGHVGADDTFHVSVNHFVSAPKLFTDSRTVVCEEGDSVSWKPSFQATGYTVTNLPPGATWDPASGTVTWQTGEQHGGHQYVFTVRTIDTPHRSWDVEVSVIEINNHYPVMQPPVLAEYYYAGDEITIDVSATDADDNDTITYALMLPSMMDGATIVENESGHHFSWTAPVSLGYQVLTFHVGVFDTMGRSTSQQLAIELREKPVLGDAPSTITVYNGRTDAFLIPLTERPVGLEADRGAPPSPQWMPPCRLEFPDGVFLPLEASLQQDGILVQWDSTYFAPATGDYVVRLIVQNGAISSTKEFTVSVQPKPPESIQSGVRVDWAIDSMRMSVNTGHDENGTHDGKALVDYEHSGISSSDPAVQRVTFTISELEGVPFVGHWWLYFDRSALRVYREDLTEILPEESFDIAFSGQKTITLLVEALEPYSSFLGPTWYSINALVANRARIVEDRVTCQPFSSFLGAYGSVPTFVPPNHRDNHTADIADPDWISLKSGVDGLASETCEVTYTVPSCVRLWRDGVAGFEIISSGQPVPSGARLFLEGLSPGAGTLSAEMAIKKDGVVVYSLSDSESIIVVGVDLAIGDIDEDHEDTQSARVLLNSDFDEGNLAGPGVLVPDNEAFYSTWVASPDVPLIAPGVLPVPADDNELCPMTLTIVGPAGMSGKYWLETPFWGENVIDAVRVWNVDGAPAPRAWSTAKPIGAGDSVTLFVEGVVDHTDVVIKAHFIPDEVRHISIEPYRGWNDVSCPRFEDTVHVDVGGSNVSLVASDAYMREGTDTATFVISRDEGNLQTLDTVWFEIDTGRPDAAQFSDVDIIGARFSPLLPSAIDYVSIGRGQSSVTIQVRPHPVFLNNQAAHDDDIVEWDEVVAVRLIAARTGIDDPSPVVPISEWCVATVLDDDGVGLTEVQLRTQGGDSGPDSRNVDRVSTGEGTAAVSDGHIIAGIRDGDVKLATRFGTSAFAPQYVGNHGAFAVIAVDTKLPDLGDVASLSAVLHLAHLPAVTTQFVPESVLPGTLTRYTFEVDATGLPSGRYPYDVVFTATDNSGQSRTRTIHGAVDIVNRVGDAGSRNALGDGWAIPEADQLTFYDGLYHGSDDLPADGGDTAYRLALQGLDNAIERDDLSGALLIRSDNSSAFYSATEYSFYSATEYSGYLEAGSDDECIGSSYHESGPWYGVQGTVHGTTKYRYTNASQSGATASWTLERLEPGKAYHLFTTWQPAADRVNDAVYTVTGAARVGDPDASSTTAIHVDQRYVPGPTLWQDTQWRSLGFFYPIGTSGQITIELSSSKEGILLADGVVALGHWPFETPAGSFDELQSDGSVFSLRDKYGTWRTFAGTGMLIDIEDRLGNRTVFDYGEGDQWNRIQSITEPGGMTTRFEYAGDWLSKVIDAYGRSTSYQIDTSSTTITLPSPGFAQSDVVWTFGYQGHLLNSITTPNGCVTTLEYEHHRLSSVTNAVGEKDLEQRSIQSTWQLESVYAAELAATRNTHAGLYGSTPGSTESLYTDPRGGVWKYRTDRFGRLVQKTAPTDTYHLSTDTWRWHRDEVSGLLKESFEPAGGQGWDAEVDSIRTLGALHTRYYYQKNGNLVSRVTMEDNGILVYDFWSFSGWRPGISSDEEALQRRIAEAFSECTSRSMRDASYGVSGIPIYILDTRGRTRRTIEHGGAPLAPLRETVTTYTTIAQGGAQPAGLITSVTVAAGVGDQQVTTFYEYESKPGKVGQLLSVTEGYGTSLAATAKLAYDKYGNRSSITDALNRTTKTIYDALGRLVFVAEPNPGTGDHVAPWTLYRYDALGARTLEIDSRGTARTWDYDALGRLNRELLSAPGGDPATPQAVSETQYFYDAAGNLDHVIDPLGRTTQHEYSIRNQRVTTTLPRPNVELCLEIGEEERAAPVYQYRYDCLGNLTSETDGRGNVTQYGYDGVGNRVAVVQPAAAGQHGAPITEYKYDFLGRVREVRAPGPNGTTVTGYDYDPLGRLTKVTLPGTGAGTLVTSYEYDLRDNLRFVRESNGAGTSLRTTEYQYDLRDRRIQEKSPDPGYGQVQLVVNYGYNDADEMRWKTELSGGVPRTTFYTHDNLGRIVGVTLPAPDPNDVGEGSPAISYTYDAAGNQLAVTVVGTRGGTLSTITEYDALNRPWRVLGASTDGTRTEKIFVYDLAGRRTAVRERTEGSTWRTTNYVFDDLDRLHKEILPEPTAGTTRPTSTYYHDRSGNLTCFIDPLGLPTIYGYDALNRKIGEASYTASPGDADGRVIVDYRYYIDGSLRSVVSDAAPTEATTYEYDAGGRQTKVIQPGGRVSEYGYDLYGNLIWVNDAEDNVTSYDYDGLNRQVCETIHIGEQDLHRQSRYDAWGNAISYTDRLNRSITYAYDALNRRTGETWCDADGTPVYTSSFSYTTFSELDTAADATSSYTFQYDSQRRIQTVNGSYAGLPDGFELEYQYNLLGMRKQLTATAQYGDFFFTNGYTPDALGRLERVTQSGLAGARVKSVDFDYRSNNAPNSIIRTAESVISTGFGYYSDGRLASIAHTSDGPTTPPQAIETVTLQYDPRGRVSNWMSTREPTRTYTYDPVGELDQPGEVYSPNGSRQGSNFTVGPYNRQLAFVDGDFNVHTVGYDDEGNIDLEQVWEFLMESDDSDTTFQSQNMIQTTGSGAGYEDSFVEEWSGTPSAQWSFQFETLRDPVIQIAITWPTPPAGETYATKAVYSLCNGSQVLTTWEVDQNVAPNDLEAGGVRWKLFTYHTPPGNQVGHLEVRVAAGADSQGTLVADAVVLRTLSEHTSFQFDHYNRLTHATVGRVTDTTTTYSQVDYVYDVLGRQIAKKYDADSQNGYDRVEQYVYDGDNVLMQFDGQGRVTQRSFYGQAVDQLLAIDKITWLGDVPAGETYWTLADQQQTVREVIRDETGELAESFSYDDFGQPLNVTLTGTEPWANVVRHAGRKYEPETGLYNNRARYYDPQMRRFMSEDPLGFAGGDTNLYRYCGNSPTNATDPSGCVALVDDMIILGLIGLNLWVWGNNAVMADAIVHDQPINPSNTPYSADYWKGAAVCTTVGASLPLAPYVLPTGAVTAGAVGLGGYGLYKEGPAAWQSYRRGNYFQAAYHTANVALIGYGGYRAFARPVPTGPAAVAAQESSPFASRAYYAGAGIDAETGAVTSAPGFNTVAYAGLGVDSATGATIMHPGLAPSVVSTARLIVPTNPAFPQPQSQIRWTWAGHQNAALAEEQLARTVHSLPDEVVVRWGDPIGAHGSDVISVNMRSSQVTLWDSKFRSAGVSVQPSPTFQPGIARLNNAVQEAIRTIQNNQTLPPNVRHNALNNLLNGQFRTRTVGAGNARNSCLQ
jgi:RHS repeat-associated protein